MDPRKGGSLQALRRTNRELLLELLLEHGPIHRAELARRSALSRTTVSTIVGELLERGVVLLADNDVPTGAKTRDGRIRDLLSVNPTVGAALGMDFTLDRVWVHLADLAGDEIASAGVTVPANADWSARVRAGTDLLDQLLTKTDVRRETIVGAGIGVPGPVRTATGEVGASLPDLPWAGVNAALEFGRRLGVPVTIENNTRLEAIAEVTWGPHRGARNLFYFGLSSGIGSGLIIDGHLFHGAVGAAGELGHVSIDVEGPPCPCGNRGCLVLYAGVPAVLRTLETLLGRDVRIDEVLQAVSAGDSTCREVVSDVGRTVGKALASLCNLINPERIVVGGELAHAGEILLTPMRDELRQRALSMVRDVPVEAAELSPGVRAGALGGAALVLRDVPYIAAALAHTAA